MIKFLLLVGLCITLISSAFSQKTISGVVRDAADGSPLPGVNVTVMEKAGAGTMTGVDGRFTLKLPVEGKTLVFSFVGYTPQEVLVGKESVFQIALRVSAQKIEEVVVTALGVKKEVKTLGYAFTDVAGSEIAQANAVAPLSVLQGKVAGVQVDIVGSSVTAAPRINIRGNSTFSGNNQPIIVLDGIILQNDVASGSQNWGNWLKNLNPSDIESMSVLRGTAATALYGAQALNGVILVTTKSGKVGAGMSVEMSNNSSWAILSPPFDYQNEYGAGVFAGINNNLSNKWFTTQEFRKTTAGKDQLAPTSISWGPKMKGQKVIDYVGDEVPYVPYRNNWKDMLEQSYTSTTNVAISNSTERLTYRASFTYQGSKGIMRKNNFEKYNVDFNTSFKINDYMRIKAHVIYIPTRQTNPAYLNGDGTYSVGRAFFGWNGLTRSYNMKKFDNPKYYLSKVYNAWPQPPRDPSDLGYNVPLASKLFYYNNWKDEVSKENNFLGNFSMDIDVAKWFTFTVGANGSAFFNKFANNTWFDGGDQSNRMTRTMSESYFTEIFAKANFHKDFLNKDLNVSLSLMAQRQDWRSENLSGFARIQTMPGFWFWDNFPDVGDQKFVSGGINDSKRINSATGYLDISYKDQLFFSLTGRNDWMSVLVYSDGHGTPSLFYPSASVSWLADKTFKLPEWVSFAKIRGSYGETGGASVGSYGVNSYFSARKFSYLDKPGIGFQNSSLPNQNLKPYRMRELEFGVDFRFFNSRIGLDVAWYRRNTTNQIMWLPVASESGVSSMMVNAGKLRNTGVEITLNATPVKTRDFSWDIHALYTWQRSKVVNLYPEITRMDLSSGTTVYSGAAARAYEGSSYGAITSTNMPKVYLNPENPSDPNNGKFIADWDDDGGTITYVGSGTEQYMGDINPKFIGSLGNTLTYKNLSLDFQFYFKIGGQIASSTYTTGILGSGNGKSSLAYRDKEHGGIVFTTKAPAQAGGTFEDGYIPQNIIFNKDVSAYGNSIAGMTYEEALNAGLTYPSHISSYYWGNYAGGGVAGNQILENSYITLKYITLSYALPQKWAAKMKLNKLSLSAYARDVAVLYNTLPDRMNPYILNSNESAAFTDGEGLMPFISTVGFSVNLGF